MNTPLPAYVGDEPYVFVSYAHADAVALKEIRWLQDQGVRVWYDEGISPGSEWSHALGEAIAHCERFIYFITPRSVASENCRRELSFALEEQRSVLAVHLEETDVPYGIRLSLNNRQAILRPKVGEGAYRAALLQAIHGTPANADRAAHPIAETKRWRRRGVWAVGAVAGAACIGLLAWWFNGMSRAPPADAVTLEVRAFDDEADSVASRQMTAGLRDELVHQLAQIPWLGVTTGAKTGEYYALSGSLRPNSDGQARISVQLADERDRTIWSANYDATLDNLVPTEVNVATQITRAMSPLVALWQLRGRATSNDNAWLAFSRGVMTTFSQQPADLRRALAYFEQAVHLDPEFAMAWAMEGSTYQNLTNFGPMGAEEAVARMRPIRDTALAIDPDEPMSLLLNAQLQLYDLDFDGAERSVRRALANGGGGIAAALGASAYFMQCGRYHEALELIDRASLADPISPVPAYSKAQTLWYAHRLSESLAQADAFLEITPSDPRMLGMRRFDLLAMGRWGEAIDGLPGVVVTDELRKVVATQGREWFGHYYLQVAQAVERGEVPGPRNTVWRASSFGDLLLGRYEEALEWFTRGWEAGDRWEILAARSYPLPGFAEFWSRGDVQAYMKGIIGDPPTCPGWVESSSE